MPSEYNGQPQTLLGLIPSSVAISSTSATTPVVVTTAAPHGCTTGDIVVIHGAEAAINEEWECVVTGVTTLQLIGSSSGVAGGANGTIHNAGFGSKYQIPSGTDAFSVAAFNVALEAFGDRTSLLSYLLSYDIRLRAGGVMSVHDGATIEVQGDAGITIDAAGSIQADSGSQLTGLLTIGPGSSLNAGNLGTLGVNSGGFLTVSAGGLANIFGTENIESGGKLVNLAGGLIDIKGDGDASDPSTPGDVIYRNGAKLEAKSGAVVQLDAGAALLLDGATSGSPTLASTWHGVAHVWDNCDQTYAGGSQIFGTKTDASTTTRTAPTIYSGDNGYQSLRDPLIFGDEDATVHPERQEHVVCQVTGGAGHLTDDRTCTVNLAPAGMRVEITISARASDLSIKTLTIKSQGGSTLFTLVGTDQGDPKWVRMLISDSGYRVIGSYKASNG